MGEKQEVRGVAADELARRLFVMADAGDFGRGPDPTDVRRLAAKALLGLESSLRLAVWNYSKAKGLSDDAAYAAVEFEVGRATIGRPNTSPQGNPHADQ